VGSRLPRLARWGTVSRLDWRVMLVQLLSNAIVIGALIAVLPGFHLHAKHPVLAVLWLAVLFGVLSAFVRPVLEFLLLPYLLQSLGLVLVLIDAALLAALALTPELQINGILALAFGAVIFTAAGLLVDSLLGLTPPVVDDASARAERGDRLIRIAAISERLRLMQVYGLLTQYVVDVAFDWWPLRPVRRRMQTWLWRPPVPIVSLPPQVKLRLLLEDLGPTYVKLGQIVSSQARVLPLEWEEELARLQSNVRPFAYEDVRAIVSGSLGGPPERLYDTFDPTPLAAASLAQVHEATTHDGRRVAVKVQRPNIHEQLQSDVRIITRGARLLESRLPWARDAGLTGVVGEFGTTLLREFDYSIESYNARRLERVLEPIEGVHVPEVDAELSSDRVLTLEFVDGVKSTDIEAIDAAGIDRHGLAQKLVRGAVQMVMVEGFFHADPHPGNVLVEPATGGLTFLDTGMVGQLELSKRITFSRFLLAFRDKDISGLATTLRSLSRPFRPPDEAGFDREFEQRIGPLLDPPPGRVVALQRLVAEALDVLRGNGYQLDSQLSLAVKAVAQAEAITSALVPDADASYFAELGGGALEELVPAALERIGVRDLAKREAILAVGEVAESLPSMRSAARLWLDNLQRGEMPVRVRLPDLDRPIERFEAVPRLIALAIVLGGVLIGSALAAGIAPTTSFRSNVADVALVIFLVATAFALVLSGVLLWRLVRPRS
jgi:ubiquinone biosynthesis protein